MNTELILQHILGIWEALLEGDEEEKRIANLLFLVYSALQEKWLGLKRHTTIKVKTKTQDEIEVYLKHIAEL